MVHDPDAGVYLCVTPSGCYHAIESRTRSAERELLFALLRSRSAPFAVKGGVWTASGDGRSRTGLSTRLLRAGFVERLAEPCALPPGTLSEHLPPLLGALSGSGGAVLVESGQGLSLGSTGMTRELAEELAALATASRELAERRIGSLAAQVGLRGSALAIVDPAGGSEIGFWPLYIADHVFVLAIIGVPLFNTLAFRTLVWLLVERYGKPLSPSVHR